VKVSQVGAGSIVLGQCGRIFKFGPNPDLGQSTRVSAPARFMKRSLGANQTHQTQAIEIQVCSPPILMQRGIIQSANREVETSDSEAKSHGTRRSPQRATSEASTEPCYSQDC